VIASARRFRFRHRLLAVTSSRIITVTGNGAVDVAIINGNNHTTSRNTTTTTPHDDDDDT
jgi:hypothetical protein